MLFNQSVCMQDSLGKGIIEPAAVYVGYVN